MEPLNKEPLSRKPRKPQYSPPPRHTAILKPASLNAKKAAQQRETKKSGGETKAMVTHESVGRRMTRSMTASQAASSQPQEDPSAGDIQPGSSHPTEDPKPATKARKKPTAVPKAKGSQTAATMTKTGMKTKRQLPVEEQASPASGLQEKPASRRQRPKAIDFYESPEGTKTPESTAGPLPPKTPPENIVKPEPAAPAPETPAIPWDIYGIAGSAGDAQAQSRPVETATKAMQKPSAQNVLSLPAPDTAVTSEEELSENQEADPHDKSMDADYIDTGPGPYPKHTKLRKAAKKRPKKQQPAPKEPEPNVVVDRAVADTPYPFPPSPPKQPAGTSRLIPPPPPPPPLSPPVPLPPVIDNAPEPDPAIWNVGTNAPPLHATPRGPARPGSVYCETCFRDDVARWIRIRDGVVRELRILALEVEEAELSSTEEYQASRVTGKGLRTPEDEAEGPAEGAVAAKKITVMSDYGYSWEAPHFNEYPSDTVGIVLLRILAERPTSGLNRSQKDQVNGLLDSLRRDVDISPRSLVPGQQNIPGKAGHWWWDFDNTLQAAHEEISADTHLPSLFVSTLATKAHHASLGLAETRNENNTPHPALSLAEVEKALLMTTLSNAFLKSIGDKLALAKHQLTHPASPPTPTSPKQKRALSPDPNPDSSSPPPKRRKPNTTTTTTTPPIHCCWVGVA
ncbi:hypothetical protein F5144DRAFT_592129 [Chaetomium tenue]|uniref:Uncharacterized protein n=1 Tax=Chaetomium tenue TaxID=1854479 RepID=A0ACB7PDB4_9PEZI|nr:hypothetical protein F5144DRAFT_592129 [Chaetomium globosum]